MAIRFLCGACRQPIEIDDDWASKLVACPFCRKTIMAPAASELAEMEVIPTAVPLLRGAPGLPPARQEHPNRVAIVAFALVCLVVLQFVGMAQVIGPHRKELDAFELRRRELKQQGVSVFAAGQQAMAVLEGSQDGSIPGWLISVSLLQMSMIGCWLGAVVCGLVGMRRRRNRRWAVSSLVLAGLIPILMLGSGSS